MAFCAKEEATRIHHRIHKHSEFAPMQGINHVVCYHIDLSLLVQHDGHVPSHDCLVDQQGMIIMNADIDSKMLSPVHFIVM